MLTGMPELPDITVYVEALERRIFGQRLDGLSITSPFLLRTFDPPPEATEGKRVTGLSRLGKRIGFHLEDDLFLVLHLMIAGRLHWYPHESEKLSPKTSYKSQLARFEFSSGELLLTEASKKKRASLHIVRGEAEFLAHRPPGMEVPECSLEDFRNALTRRNHTLKRALTSPQLFSGIGNAYSDEILHRAQLSPIALSQKLAEEEIERLYQATQQTMQEWIDRLRQETGDGFPRKVTAFREEMAVHGRYGLPCPVCDAPVKRIRYAENETNYCARCQTGGKVLADRSLSRLLKDEWPRRIEDWE